MTNREVRRPVRELAGGLGFTEGPTALADGRVAVTSLSHGCVYLIQPDGTTQRIDTGGGPNGLVAADDGTLYVAQNGGVWGGSAPAVPGVQIIQDGSVEYLVEHLGAPNDLVLGPDGRLWVSDTVAEFSFEDISGALPGAIHAIDVSSGDVRTLREDGPLFTNGLVFTENGDRLLVTGTLESQLMVYPVRDGTLDAGSELLRFEGANPDGMARTPEGRFWVALLAADRLDLVDLEQGIVDTIVLPEGSLPSNVCLDHSGHGLYVTTAWKESIVHVEL